VDTRTVAHAAGAEASAGLSGLPRAGDFAESRASSAGDATGEVHVKLFGLFSVVFLGIGLVLDGVALVAYFRTRGFLAEAQRAQGTVLENVEVRSSSSSSSPGNRVTFAPRIRFATAEGATIEFTSGSSSSPAEYQPGETAPVLYERTNPAGARVDGFFSIFGVSFVFGLLGAIFTAVGAGFGAALLVFKRRRAEVLARGTPIQARVVGVERNRSVRVNGRNPWRITCQWQDPKTSRVHVFSSDDIWFDPTEHVKSEQLSVLILPDNPRRYMVDISFLPKLAD
jgi:Protein of unknown function (DUF3592)